MVEFDDYDALVLENIPESCLNQDCIIGIDEAGRGPVLGPLVYAIFICPVDEQPLLKELSAGDSKEKSINERDTFYEALTKDYHGKLGWKTAVLHPKTISNCMLQKEKYNLNSLSHDTVFSLIEDCLKRKNIRITQGFVDTLGPADKYEAKLSARFPGIKFTVRSKADSLFPVVGAASIVAKVTRDRSLANIMKLYQFQAGGEFGCGYPSDPTTVKWLQANLEPVFGWPEVVRFSWSSCDRLLNDKAVKVVWPEDGQEARLSDRTISSLYGLA